MRQRVIFFVGGLLAVAGLFLAISRLTPLPRQTDGQGSITFLPDRDEEEFFQAYWQRPIALQGKAPASFTDKEASLAPEACGSCHPQQYADWKESLHSKAMGPGPWGQIIDLTRSSPEEALLCMTCHAPLSEQMPFIARAANGRKLEKNGSYDPKLQLQGITCAACHLRQHQRFGPPKAEGAAATRYPPEMASHGGVKRTPHLEKARFCMDCHQFDPENSLLLNGKPLQDTYREWQSSIWGRGEASCQGCHMPNRRHLWKGIHDAAWVKEGVRIEAEIRRQAPAPASPAELAVEITNSAVGHKFPTYVTPKVFVRAALLDRNGRTLPGTQQEKIIGWDARFEGDRWKEYFDTRIAPGGKSQNLFRWTVPAAATTARAWVEVHPDHFYHVHFYPPYLTNQELSPEGKKLIEKALQDSGRTSYVLFEKRFSLR